jgi:hypothetical protein
MIDNMTSYPWIQPAVPSSYVYPDDRPATTNRESVENSLYHIMPDAAPKSGTYEVLGIASPALTSRDKTNVQYSGSAAASSKPRVYDAEYNTAALTVRNDSISEWYARGAMSLPPSSSMTAATTTQPRTCCCRTSSRTPDNRQPAWMVKGEMNVLQHAQETAPQDAWASGNAAYFSAQESPQHRAHFNMLKTSSSSQAITYTTSNRNAERYGEFREPTLRHFLRIPDHPARKQEDIEIKQHIDEYYSAYPHYASSNLRQPHQNLLVYIHLHSNSDHYPRHAPLQPTFSDEGALFCALGWYVTRNEILRQFGKARTDVKIGTPQLIDLIYTLGGLYYHAA